VETFMRRSARIIAALLAGLATPALADPIADFYSGKQIKFVIRSGVGGSYDSYSRLLGRHIGRHIPGNPSVVPLNMPGGGGIRSANYVAKVAPQDGTILTIVSQGLVIDQALGLNASFQADLRDFQWVGNISASNQVLVTWHTSPTRTLADLMRRETVIGSSQAGSISVQMPAVLNNIVGTRIKIVFGYPDGRDINLAMERGEVEGRATNPWSSYISTDPQYVDNKLIIPIIQIGMQKESQLPDVPLLRDLAKDAPGQAVLDFMSKAVAFGRPIATTPGVPAERVAALRKAFTATMSDPALIAEASKAGMELGERSGEEVQSLVAKLYGLPEGVIERTRRAMVYKGPVK
jgi:tripartite-type tricarboxylate transporter receptor subunit TctC